MGKLLNKVAIPVLLLLLVMAYPLHAYATTDVPGVKSPTPTPATHEPKPHYALGFNAGYTNKTNDLCSVFSMKEYDNCINGFSQGHYKLLQSMPQYMIGWQFGLQKNGSMTGNEDRCKHVYTGTQYASCTQGYNDILSLSGHQEKKLKKSGEN